MMKTSVVSGVFNPVENGGRPIPPGFEAWSVSWYVKSTGYLIYKEEVSMSLSSLFVNYFVSFSVSATALSVSIAVLSRIFFWVAARRARKNVPHSSALYQELLPMRGAEPEEEKEPV